MNKCPTQQLTELVTKRIEQAFERSSAGIVGGSR